MGTVTASRLLQVWSFRLKMDDGRGRTWKPELRASVEHLVERLHALPGDQDIIIDADEARSPIARFILAPTGELLGEIDKPSDPPPNDI